jgi:prevent-host-death family protein
MTVRTVKSDEARTNFRDILDDVQAGATEVVIERWNKPAAVMVNYQQWQALRRQRLAMLDQRSAEIDAGDFLTHEQVLSEMRERGQID